MKAKHFFFPPALPLNMFNGGKVSLPLDKIPSTPQDYFVHSPVIVSWSLLKNPAVIIEWPVSYNDQKSQCNLELSLLSLFARSTSGCLEGGLGNFLPSFFSPLFSQSPDFWVLEGLRKFSPDWYWCKMLPCSLSLACVSSWHLFWGLFVSSSEPPLLCSSSWGSRDRETGIASPWTSCSHAAPPPTLSYWFTYWGLLLHHLSLLGFLHLLTETYWAGFLWPWPLTVFLPWVPHVDLRIPVPLTFRRGAYLLFSTAQRQFSSSLFPAASG